MIDPRIREIRAILIGWVRYEGIYCLAAEGFGNMAFRGLNNGADAARIRGLRELRKQYVIPEGFRKGSKTYSDIMTMLGQRVFLRSSPKALATLSRPFLLLVPPVVVTMEFGEEQRILCCFYTAKSLLAPLRLRHVAGKLRALLPAEIRETTVTMSPSVEAPAKPAGDRKPKRKRGMHEAGHRAARPEPAEESEETAEECEET